MKRYLPLFLLPVLVFLTGASVWEGAASVSADGELPDDGYYAITNSFPRNTVVDVTNLETGKSIRVIVAGSLDTPGLLAVLSRDAARNIGLRARSVGRIRMVQPQDPIAFSLFTEGLASSGDPDFDPKARIAEENPEKAPPSGEKPGAETAEGIREVPGESVFTEDPAREKIDREDIAGESGAAEDPAADIAEGSSPDGENTGKDIVDVPDYYSPPAASGAEEKEPDLAWAVPVPAEQPEVSSSPQPPESPPAAPDLAEAAPPEEKTSPPADEPGEAAEEKGLITEAESGTITELTMVPSTERPPEDWYTIPPESVIPPLSETSAPSERDAGIPAESGPAPAGIFSVPVISSLEDGKYYLQLGAYSRADAVEPAISRIGKSYPLVVQNGGNTDRPVYRVLLGPVNLGESGALLERFKSSGYSDAFVRSN
jgi:cell division septation protein DedD